MELPELAEKVFALRNSRCASEIIFEGAPLTGNGDEPVGVLLFKPSSGHLPLRTIHEILHRLVAGHQCRVRAAAWWNGGDLRAHEIMRQHYPGFYRVAHGGWTALPPPAKTRVRELYAGDDFARAFGTPFDLRLLRGPYALVREGMAPAFLNELWENAAKTTPAHPHRIHRLDDDAFGLALLLPNCETVPAALRGQTAIVLNGFFPKLAADFESQGCVAVWIQKEAGSPASWERLRAEFAGQTNPFQAASGTVRGDAARGALEVENVSILANVIHLSANPAEGQREVREVWWEPARVADVFKTVRSSPGDHCH